MTTTINESDIDTDFFTIVGSELAPPCEGVKDCDKAAEWMIVISCCGAQRLICDPHWKGFQDWLRTAAMAKGTMAECLNCKALVDPGKFVMYFEHL